MRLAADLWVLTASRSVMMVLASEAPRFPVQLFYINGTFKCYTTGLGG
jgi:hypothetical protein